MTEASQLPTIDRLSPKHRPAGRAIGYQRWTELAFVHWRLPARLVAPLLPPELTLDTWDGDAWIGLVPFRMSGVRPWWSCAVPGLSAFAETNVRTYVHLAGRDPGVWFFSLEASNPIAVWLARAGWSLNYVWAAMTVEKTGSRVHYASRRRGDPPAGCRLEVEVGAERSATEPGTLEHFLVERYVLYARSRRRGLRRGQVHHRPYPLCSARLVSLDENLLAANSLTVNGPPCHVVYSPGVSVEVFPLVPANGAV